MLFNKLDQDTHIITEKNIREKIVPIFLPVAKPEQRELLREALINGRRDGRLSQYKVNDVLRTLRDKKVISDTLRATVAEKFAKFLEEKWGEEEKVETSNKESSKKDNSGGDASASKDFSAVNSSQIDES